MDKNICLVLGRILPDVIPYLLIKGDKNQKVSVVWYLMSDKTYFRMWNNGLCISTRQDSYE